MSKTKPASARKVHLYFETWENWFQQCVVWFEQKPGLSNPIGNKYMYVYRSCLENIVQG